MKNNIANFYGSFVAIVTPFDERDRIDFEAFESLLDFHVANNTNGIVVCGTTGEASTLSTDEYKSILKFAVDHIDGRMPVVAGSGSNSTEVALKNSQNAADQGVDALLIVTPYYNKPTSKGIYLHYEHLAENLNTPILLYNVPGRTGVNMSGDLIINLGKEFDNIIGVKEASGDLEQIKYVIDHCANDFIVFSGDDNLTINVIQSGGVGCISVVANEIPQAFSELTRLAREGHFEKARKIYAKYARLMDLNFIESNPIPVKTALHQMGYIKNKFRLPMCTMTEPEPLIAELNQLGLID